MAGKLDVLLTWFNAGELQASLSVQTSAASKSTQRETRIFEERERTDLRERWHESPTWQSTDDH